MRTLKKILAIPVISVLTIMCIFSSGCHVKEDADEIDTTPTTIKVVCEPSDTLEQQDASKTHCTQKSESKVIFII